jgi:nucleotide-binding universal stress UspA family protein
MGRKATLGRRTKSGKQMDRILVGIDDSAGAARALDTAAMLAGKFGAALILVHVMTEDDAEGDLSASGRDATSRVEGAGALASPPSDARLREIGRQMLTKAEDQARAMGVRDCRTILAEGDPAEQLVRLAGEGEATLIVVGRRGIAGLCAVLLGSVSTCVVQLAPQSVLVVS